MNCKGCGHGIGYHSDRAVFPPCEGTHPEFDSPLARQSDDSDFTWIATPRFFQKIEPCLCEGFRG